MNSISFQMACVGRDLKVIQIIPIIINGTIPGKGERKLHSRKNIIPFDFHGSFLAWQLWSKAAVWIIQSLHTAMESLCTILNYERLRRPTGYFTNWLLYDIC